MRNRHPAAHLAVLALLIATQCTTDLGVRIRPGGEPGAAGDGAAGSDVLPADDDGGSGDAYTGGDELTGDNGVGGDATAGGDGLTGDEMDADGGGADEICPPCAPPPFPECVGSGPCGCGPYSCPGDGEIICGGNTVGWCAPGLTCECCPIGGPQQSCLCSTRCLTDGDCTDAARPHCNQAGAGIEGFCSAAELYCCWPCD